MVRRKPETHFPLQVTAPNSCMPNLPTLLDDHLSMTWWEGTSSHGKLGLVQFNTTISHPIHDFPLLHLQLEGLIWGFPSSRAPPFLFLWDLVLLVLEAGREDAMGQQFFASSIAYAASLAHIRGMPPGVSTLRDTCGSFGVLHMRGLRRVQPPSATSATRQLWLHGLHFPAWRAPC